MATLSTLALLALMSSQTADGPVPPGSIPWRLSPLSDRVEQLIPDGPSGHLHFERQGPWVFHHDPAITTHPIPQATLDSADVSGESRVNGFVCVVDSGRWTIVEDQQPGGLCSGAIHWDGTKQYGFALDREGAEGPVDQINVRVQATAKRDPYGLFGFGTFLLLRNFEADSTVLRDDDSLVGFFDRSNARIAMSQDSNRATITGLTRSRGPRFDIERSCTLVLEDGPSGPAIVHLVREIWYASANDDQRIRVARSMTVFDPPLHSDLPSSERSAEIVNWQYDEVGSVRVVNCLRYRGVPTPRVATPAIESADAVLQQLLAATGPVPVHVIDQTLDIEYRIGSSAVRIDGTLKTLDRVVPKLLSAGAWFELVRNQNWSPR